jgi:protein TonB
VRIARSGYAPAELGLHLTAGMTPPPLRFLLSPVETTAPPAPAPPPAAAAVPVVAMLPHARSLPGTSTRWQSGVIPPERVEGRSAAYPDEARRLRLAGTVTVEMTVTQAGEPREVRVVQSAGAILDAAVLAAVRTWRFKPAEKDGIPVVARWQFRHTFTPAG